MSVAISRFTKKLSCATYRLNQTRFITTLTPKQVTQVLSSNEVRIQREHLPSFVQSIESNQLASNSPIEDRIRVATFQTDDSLDPTLIAGVFDGHGTGITADIISRRLFNYIALGLYTAGSNLKVYEIDQVRKNVNDLFIAPRPDRSEFFHAIESQQLLSYKKDLQPDMNFADILKTAFIKCDQDFSDEIQQNLMHPRVHRSVLSYYLTAAISGCCAIVIVIHDGVCYVASSGDCRAVMGVFDNSNDSSLMNSLTDFSARDLNCEHNCDNIEEIRRLASAHPKSEQNSIIKHNRLLGNLMPFRAFGDFNYKWTIDSIKNCGLPKAFGPNVVPKNYKSPPYLIVDPEITEIPLQQSNQNEFGKKRNRFIIMATDGLWEQFDSSKEVVQAIAEQYSLLQTKNNVDLNSATHLMRAALKSGPNFEHRSSTGDDELSMRYHTRLQSLLTLPQSIVRNFRDDISVVVLKLQ